MYRGSGNIIDYIVASFQICPAISSVHFIKAPWKTHYFISFKILKAPRQRFASFLIKPRCLIDDKSMDMDSAKRTRATSNTTKALPHKATQTLSLIKI